VSSVVFLVVDPICEETAPLLEKPKRLFKQLRVEGSYIIRSQQLQFSQRRPVKTAFVFWRTVRVHRPAARISNFRSAASTLGRWNLTQRGLIRMQAIFLVR
jgi:hypothetical protein